MLVAWLYGWYCWEGAPPLSRLKCLDNNWINCYDVYVSLRMIVSIHLAPPSGQNVSSTLVYNRIVVNMENILPAKHQYVNTVFA